MSERVFRREFLHVTGGAFAASAGAGWAARSTPMATVSPSVAPPAFIASSPDPWIEIDWRAFEHNVREASRLAGCRPILAVVKNNAYGPVGSDVRCRSSSSSIPA